MLPARTRRAARITAAAVGGVLAAGLALPGAASAQNLYGASDNGVLSYTKVDHKIRTIFEDGTNDSPVTSFAQPLGVTGEIGEWSADGNRLAYVDALHNVVDINVWTGQQAAAFDDAANVFEPSISPDGTQHAFGTMGSGSRIARSGEPSRLVIDGGSADSAGTSWANNDRLVVVIDGEGIYRIDNASDLPNNRLGTDGFVVANGTNPTHVSISRDGGWVAYQDLGPDGDQNDADVMMVKADGSESPIVVDAAAARDYADTMPAISPDGTKVAFVRSATNTPAAPQHIAVFNRTTGQTTVVANTTTPASDNYQSLSWQPAEKPHLGNPKITSATEVGSTLSLDFQHDEGTMPRVHGYQWQTCTDVDQWDLDGTCANVQGATGASYSVTADDLGKRFRLVRTVTNGAGTDSKPTLITEPVVAQTVPDTDPPAVPTIGGEPASLSKETTATFTWTGAEPGGSYACSLDNAAFGPCTSGEARSIAGEGPHSFRVRQVDGAGNQGAVAEYAWTVDTTKPGKPSIGSTPPAITKATTARITFSGDEANGSLECREGGDEAGWNRCESPLDLTGRSEGDQRWSIRQLDEAGNASDPEVVAWKTDYTHPGQPTVTSDLSQVDTTGSVAIAWTGENGATYECDLDDAGWEPCTSPAMLTGQTTGEHQFAIRQYDAAGNHSPTRFAVYDVDVDGPAKPTFTGTPEEFVNTSRVVFEFTGADADGTGFECAIASLPGWEPCTSGVDVDGLPEGPHTFLVRQLDRHGNAGEEAGFTWTYDATEPAQPVVTNVPSGETTSTSIDVAVTREADAKLECELDDAGWNPCPDPVRFTGLAVGEHTLKLRQTDAAGNVSDEATVTWTILAPAPDPTPATPAVPEIPKAPETPKAPDTPEAPVKDEAPATTPQAPVETEVPAATPRAVLPVPVKPKLTALIGGDAPRNDDRISSAATITVQEDGVGVGCSITGTVLTSCRVDLYVDVETGATAKAAAARKVLVGTGTYRKRAGSSRMDVEVKLNATGRELLRRSPNGLEVSVAITGQPVTGQPLKASGIATLVRRTTTAVIGGFAVDRATPGAAGKRQLAKLARQVRGTAVAIRVAGHTDGSTTDSAYLKRLGERRARTVAKFLRAHGVRAKVTLVSLGATKPRASNATAAGRAKNRRVELRIDR